MTLTACDNRNLNVLVIETDAESVRILLETLAGRAIRGTVASNEVRALEYAEQNIWSIALVNHAFVSRFSIGARRFLARLKADFPEMPTVMLAKFDSGQIAGEAAEMGYNKVLLKPLMVECIEELLNTFAPNHETQALACSPAGSRHPYQIVGSDEKLMQTVSLAAKVAPTSAPVLITGESGTGKELIAQLIHGESQRASGPFVKVNCAALNDSLLESELFGHEKGAFTGAGSQHQGRFERAHGGTLLLDEITETQPQFQAKLLRVLENMNFERVGGKENINVNVRVISTTNTDILAEVENKRFRADLYYRLAAVKFAVPSLRQRRGDIVGLVWLFVNQFAHEAGRPITSVDTRTLQIFRQYHWPGNIRQLRNVVRTAMIMGAGEVLSLADVPWLIEELQSDCGRDTAEAAVFAGRKLRDLERRAILATLDETGGNQARAAKALGISDRTLRDKIKKYRNEEQSVSSGQPMQSILSGD